MLILALTRAWGRIRGRGEILRGANFIGADGLMSDEDNDRRSDLDKLGERLAKARGEETKPEPALSPGASAGDGLRVAVEFVVSVLVGTGLGYAIGSVLGAPIIGLVLGMPFGFAAGLRTVYRGMTAGEKGQAPDGDD